MCVYIYICIYICICICIYIYIYIYKYIYIYIYNSRTLEFVSTIFQIHGLVAVFGTFGNFSAVVLISIYRCIGIVTGSKINVTKRVIAVMLAGGWLSAILTAIPTIFDDYAASIYTPGTHHCSPSWKSSCLQYKVALALTYCITIPSMIICYVLITIKIKRSADLLEKYVKRGRTSFKRDTTLNLEAEGSNTPKEDISPEIKVENQFCEDSSALESKNRLQEVHPKLSISQTIQHKMAQLENVTMENVKSFEKKRFNDSNVKQFRRYDKRVALSGMLLVLTTTVCWTPYFIVHSCSRETTPSHALEVWTMWLGYVNAALDPIIYTVLNPKIRETVRQQHRKLFRIITPWKH
ncbi:D(4) dopamine receptor [Holothuria leucospilota]|uniref:D(4) dopamine receptor n=1 Tax=Holothuria leucospilota TaxID=206669 RepID=A0A9Q1C7T2_HOLLE|nr:D(4) dopamine receptor [Holothuria leucospilota]